MKVLFWVFAIVFITMLSVLVAGQAVSLHEALRGVGLPPGVLPLMGLCLIAIANTRKQAVSSHI